MPKPITPDFVDAIRARLKNAYGFHIARDEATVARFTPAETMRSVTEALEGFEAAIQDVSMLLDYIIWLENHMEVHIQQVAIHLDTTEPEGDA